MGKAMWELYGSSMGKINPHLSSRKTIFTQMIISPQSQPIWWTGKVSTDRDLCMCASYCLKDIGVFFNSWKYWHHAYLYIPLNFKNNRDIRVKIKIWPWIDVHVGKIVKINLIDLSFCNEQTIFFFILLLSLLFAFISGNLLFFYIMFKQW